MKTAFYIATLSLLATVTACSAPSNELPPTNGKALSEILQSLENQGYLANEADYESGIWTIEACKTNDCSKITFNAGTGNEVSRKSADQTTLPAEAKPLSRVVKTFENTNGNALHEVEFDDGLWKIEAVIDGRAMKTYIDPITGKSTTKIDKSTDNENRTVRY